MSLFPESALGEISEIRSGIGFPVAYQGKRKGAYPFAKVGDISRSVRGGNVDLSAAENYVDEPDLAALGGRPIPAGSIVFAKIGEAIRQNFRAITASEFLIDNNVMAVVPDVGLVNTRYLYHFLNSVDFYPLASATTVPSIRKSTLSKLPVPTPPSDMQRRIAEVLDRVDALREKRRKAIALLDALAQSMFLDLFGDVASECKTVPLGEVAEVSSGITKGRKVPGGAQVKKVPYLAVLNVQDKLLNLDVVKEIEATEGEIERYRLQRDDLLLTEGGDPDKLGRGTLWRNEISECIHQNHIFRVRLRCNGRIRPIYLNWIVSSDQGRRYFLRSAKQTTGIASINATQLRSFPVPVPPRDLQIKFEEQLRELHSLKAVHGKALLELDGLFAALQSRAFRGELWQHDVKDLVA